MTAKEKFIPVQETFLNALMKTKKNVEINLINGIVLKCKIISSDNFSILIDTNNKKSLVYKHSIAFIK